MKNSRFKAYEELALIAGREAGIGEAVLTPQSVEGDDAARAIRDGYWAQYERMLRDVQTYSLDQVHGWMKSIGCRVGRSSIDRNRTHLLAREQQIHASAEKARAVVLAAKEMGLDDLLAGGTLVAGQRLFEALTALPSSNLQDLTAAQTLDLIDSLSRLKKTHSDSAFTDARRKALQDAAKKFSAECKKAQSTTGDGRLSPDQINQIRQAVFGAAVS